jgi:hypothetical protein
LTADEFEIAYATRSGMTVQQLRDRGRIVIPANTNECECDCQGWHSVNSIRDDEWDGLLSKLAAASPEDWARTKEYVARIRGKKP